MTLFRARYCVAALLVFLTVFATALRAKADDVLVFAAASLKNALDQVARDYEEQSGNKITVSFAASSVLARQIQLGAPADVFISANTDWMDELEAQELVDPSARVDLLGNTLVLIGTSEGTETAELGPDFNLKDRLGEGYLAMALVDAVPAGIYGRTALENLGLWNDVSDRVAQSDNVRAALALVATGAAPLGVVYASDAQADGRVRVVGKFPADAHQPIVYPAAVVSDEAAAKGFLNYLQGDAAQAVFAAQGFTLPGV